MKKIFFLIQMSLIFSTAIGQNTKTYSYIFRDQVKELTIKITDSNEIFIIIPEKIRVFQLEKTTKTDTFFLTKVYKDSLFKAQLHINSEEEFIDASFRTLRRILINDTLFITPIFSISISPSTIFFDQSGSYSVSCRDCTEDSLSIIYNYKIFKIKNGSPILISDNRELQFLNTFNEEEIESLTNSFKLIFASLKEQLAIKIGNDNKKVAVSKLGFGLDETEKAGDFILQRNINLYTVKRTKKNRKYWFDKNISSIELLEKVSVNNVKMTLENGTIRYLTVKANGERTEKEYYFYSQIPISIATQKQYNNKRYSDRVFNTYAAGSEKEKYILFGELLRYDHHHQVRSDDFAPNDTTIEVSFEPTESQSIVPLNKTTIRNIFQIRAYTDLLGLLSNEPNGILQFEASLMFRLRNIYVRNSSSSFFNYLEPTLRYSDFKNSFDALPIRSITGTNQFFVDALDVVQFSKVNLGFRFNLFKKDLRNISGELHFNLLGNLLYNEFLDSISPGKSYQNPKKFQKVSNTLGTEIMFRKKVFSNFGIDFSFGLYNYYLFYNRLKTSFGYSYTDYLSNDGYLGKHKSFLNNLIYNPSFTLYRYTGNGKGRKAVYVRASYYNIVGNSRRNNFLQLQLGYSVNIEELIKE